MTTPGFKRKLSAILMADVVGYSSLMGDDEAATLQTLTAYHGIIDSLIRQHGGRIVEAPGDAVLAEFSSVVDAVQCAVAVQKELAVRNAELPENRRMQFRIGINLGDVIEEGDKIYRDGVNIAARLEAMAEPGGICISKTAFDHIETKLPLGYEYLGEQTLKNIIRPIGAYRVLLEPRVLVARGVPKEKAAWRPPGKPLAVAVVLLGLAVIAWGVWKSGGFSFLWGKPGASAGTSSPAPVTTSPVPAPPRAAAPEAPLSKESVPAPGPSSSPVVPSPQPAPAPGASSPAAPTPAPAPQVAALPPAKPPAAAAPSNLFRMIDKNADGQISLEEFLGWRGESFSRLDANRDGFLSRSELAAAGTVFAQRTLKYFARIDTNHDQQLSREEFEAAGRRRFLQLDSNRDGRLSAKE